MNTDTGRPFEPGQKVRFKLQALAILRQAFGEGPFIVGSVKPLAADGRQAVTLNRTPRYLDIESIDSIWLQPA